MKLTWPFRIEKKKLLTCYGIDIQDTAIYLLALERTAECYTVTAAACAPLPQGAVVNLAIRQHEVVTKILHQLLEQAERNSGLAIVAVPAATAISKQLSLENNLTDQEIEQYLNQELPQHLNVAPETVYFDYERLPGKEASDIRAVAVRCEEVDARVAVFHHAGWQVTVVDTEPLALERAIRCLIAPQKPQALVAVMHMALNAAMLYVMRDGYLIFNRTEHSSISSSEIAADWQAVFQRLWQSFAFVEPTTQLDKLFLSGDIAVINKIMAALMPPAYATSLGKNQVMLQPVTPFANCKISADIDSDWLNAHAPHYFLSCGLALRQWES